jgi:Arc/MetJ-type ribon-helix-helix transcriptional regulator
MTMQLTPEMQAAIERLHALPEADQERLAPQINDYLTRLEELREAIREGEESGPAVPLDLDAIKRDARQQWEAGRS